MVRFDPEVVAGHGHEAFRLCQQLLNRLPDRLLDLVGSDPFVGALRTPLDGMDVAIAAPVVADVPVLSEDAAVRGATSASEAEAKGVQAVAHAIPGMGIQGTGEGQPKLGVALRAEKGRNVDRHGVGAVLVPYPGSAPVVCKESPPESVPRPPPSLASSVAHCVEAPRRVADRAALVEDDRHSQPDRHRLVLVDLNAFVGAVCDDPVPMWRGPTWPVAARSNSSLTRHHAVANLFSLELSERCQHVPLEASGRTG